MTTDLATFISGNTMPVLSDDALADAINKVQTARGDTPRGGQAQFLKFNGKTARYSLGREAVDIDPEDLYIVEPMSFTEGWICWKSGVKAGEHEWSFFRDEEDGVPSSDLADHGPFDAGTSDGWKAQKSFGCISTDGQATAIKFQTSTVSALYSVDGLMNGIKDRSALKEAPIPIVHFDSEVFVAQGNSNSKPTFPVEAWVTRSSVTAYGAGEMTIEDLLSGKAPKKIASKK